MNQKSWYVLRIVLGMYLTYLGVNTALTVTADKPKNMGFMLFMAGIFCVVGVLYAVNAIRKVWAMRNEETENIEEDSADDNEETTEEEADIVEDKSGEAEKTESVKDVVSEALSEAEAPVEDAQASSEEKKADAEQ